MAVSDQMEMALNESERQDPVSGNDVPMGSLPEEVRDDVPAMLSEGEYVVPADVLRFYGLKFFEDLRTDAKVQIAQMADEGRIGGEPIAGPGPAAPTPDQPNGLDLSPEDMQKLESVLQASEGGAVGFNVGGLEQGLDQSEQGGAATQKVSMDMEADAKTDQLIDRIMGAVQKNPSLQQKLAAKGVGFMEGGVVQGYAPGGLSVEDAIKAQSKYATKRFNPFDPNWMLGMSASGLQDPLAGQMYGQMPKPVTAAQLQEDAGVIKPKEQPDGPDQDPNEVYGLAGKSTTDLATDIQEMKDTRGKKGILGLIANSILGDAHLANMEKELASRPEVTIGGDYAAGPKSGGPGNQGSKTGGSSTTGGGSTSSNPESGVGTGSGMGLSGEGSDEGNNDTDNTFGMDGFSMGKGGFISRRKKT